MHEGHTSVAGRPRRAAHLRTGGALLGVLLLTLLLAGCASTADVVLTGQVTDAYTGEPLSAAEAQIGTRTLELDGDGSYTTTNWTGDDTLTLSAPGYEPRELPLAEQAQQPQDEVITITLDTTLRPNTLIGTLTDACTAAPIPDTDVRVGGAAAELRVTTDKQGQYMFEGVPESFTLAAEPAAYQPASVELEQTIAHDLTLEPYALSGTLTDQYSGEPVAGAQVQVGDTTQTTDEQGQYTVTCLPTAATTVTVDAEGYAPVAQTLADVPLTENHTLDATLRPDVLRAQLVDSETGSPVQFATIIATETTTSTALTSARIDNQTDGTFALDDMPESGYVQVLAPGYRKATLEISAGNLPSEISLEPFYARALYVKTTTAAWLPERMQTFYEKMESTELNALVIDLKSDNLADLGLIYYESQVPMIQELGTSEDLMDIHGILAEAERRDIYTIARIHIFAHDNLLAETKPEWAAQDAGGCVPNENRVCNGDVFYADWDIAWLDPWNRNVWDYNIQLGVEAAQLGFDEVQFDYIRFPNDASNYEDMVLSQPTDWRNNPEPMFENIATFMEQAHEAINHAGAFFSVDIFGYAIWGPQDQIGQSADIMAPHADYIYPMVYPSHFWVNELGFDNAAAHPYEIIYESMEYGNEMVGDKRAQMRPWLQDFTLIWVPSYQLVEYGVPEVRAQIDAAHDSPYTAGWAVWDPDNEYTLDAFLPEAQSLAR